MFKREIRISSVVSSGQWRLMLLFLIFIVVLAYLYLLQFKHFETRLFSSHLQQLVIKLEDVRLERQVLAESLASRENLPTMIRKQYLKTLANWSENLLITNPSIYAFGVFNETGELIGEPDTLNIQQQHLDWLKSSALTSRTEKIFIEADMHPHWVVVMPIAQTGYTMLVGFSFSDLSTLIELLAEEDTFYRLTIEDTTIAEFGNNAGQMSRKLKIAGGPLVLKSSRAYPDTWEMLQKPVFVMGLMWLIFSLVLINRHRKLATTIRDDLSRIQRVSGELASQHAESKTHEPDFKLAEMRELYHSIHFMMDEIKHVHAGCEERDRLTGLHNEKRFADDAARYFDLASRGIGIMLILVDIDELSSINEQFGEPTGDQLIIGIGGILHAAVRSTDHIYHMGNGHFALLMLEMPQGEVLKWYEYQTRRFDPLRQQLSQHLEGMLQISVSATAARVEAADGSLAGTVERCQKVLDDVKKTSPGIIVLAKETSEANSSAQKPLRRKNPFRPDDDLHHPWQ